MTKKSLCSSLYCQSLVKILKKWKRKTLQDEVVEYSLFIQEVIQGFHCKNSDATIEIYYENENGSLCQTIYCVISDHQNTIELLFINSL